MREDIQAGYQRVAISQVGTPGSVAILAAVPGEKIKLVALIGSLSADGTLQLFSNTTARSGAIDALGKLPFGIRGTADAPLVVTAAGEALKLTSTGGGFNGFAVVYVEGA